MSNLKLPILCLDFDGVVHSYASGWQGAAIVPDPPVPGAVEFLANAVRRFRVAIYSSRSGQPGGIKAMRGWLTMFVLRDIDDRREAEHVLSLIEWPTEKPAALVTLDDRAITFTGVWPSLDDLAAFLPWNKREPPILTAPLTPAVHDVLAERRRQIEEKGWTAEHDDQHGNGSLATAAGCYAFMGGLDEFGRRRIVNEGAPYRWPWELEHWKPTDRRRDLVKACALALAEIERLDRMTARDPA